MIGLIKGFAPQLVYVIGFLFLLLAMTGKTQWLLIFLAGILPLRNVIEKLHTMPMGKDFLDILLIIAVVGWIIGSLSNRQKFLEFSSINFIAMTLILYTFISLIQGFSYLHYSDYFNFSDSRIQIWKNFCTLPLLFFLVFNNIKERKWIWRMVAMMCFSMLIVDYYTLNQISWFSGIISRKKIHGTFVYLGPNELAAFFNQYSMILLGIYYGIKKKIPKMWLLAIILMNLYCVMFLFSRAAYAGLAIGLFFMFAFRDKKLLIPLILAVVFWHVALPQKVKDRIEMTTNNYGELDESSEARLMLWQHSIDLFKESPISGVGFAVFQKLGFSYQDTHNIYLKILSEQGLIGILIFFILMGIFFAQGMRLYHTGCNDTEKGLGLGFAVCIVVLMINNMFGNRWTYLSLSAYLWIFAGIVARLNTMAREEKQPAIPKKK